MTIDDELPAAFHGQVGTEESGGGISAWSSFIRHEANGKTSHHDGGESHRVARPQPPITNDP